MKDVSSATADVKASFGVRLGELRAARAMTFAALSRSSGLSVRRVVQIEYGDGDEPTMGEIIALSTALWIPVAEMIAPTLSAKGAAFAADVDSAGPGALAAVVDFMRRITNLGLRLVRGGQC